MELSAVRNVIAHRLGIADRRFLEACPWFNVELGDEVVVDGSKYSQYRAAVNAYAINVIERGAVQAQQFEPGRKER